MNAKYGITTFFEEYYLTLPLDFLCPRFLSTLYHKSTSGSMSTGTAYLRKQTNLCFDVMQNLKIWGGS